MLTFTDRAFQVVASGTAGHAPEKTRIFFCVRMGVKKKKRINNTKYNGDQSSPATAPNLALLKLP